MPSGLRYVLAATCAIAFCAGCVPDKDDKPEWQAPPKSWNPQGDELSFGKKNLEAFNSLSASDQDAHVEKLKNTPNSFKGQAHFQRATELGEKMDDVVLGKYEVFADLNVEREKGDEILYEIKIDYHLFAPEQIGQGLPPGTYIEFTGTLAELYFQNDSKPRKIEMKVKDATVTRLED